MKEILKIRGNKALRGEVCISGAKNSLVALIPAAIITKSIVKLTNVKPIEDTYTLMNILKILNVYTLYDDKSVLYIDARYVKNEVLDNENILKMRASYYFMGVLLSLYSKVSVIGPGGCNFGNRPIDLHLYAFSCLGIETNKVGIYYEFTKRRKDNCSINFYKISMGATINAILAGCKGKGAITINNPSKEPEIDDLIAFLNKAGAKIKREDNRIIINRVMRLKSVEYEIMPDRIEAGTFLIIGALLADKLKIVNGKAEHLDGVLEVLKKIGVGIKVGDGYIEVRKEDNYRPVDVVVKPYPEFPTDLQQPLSVLLSTCNGESTIRETIYPARLSHIDSLNKMGANIEVKDDLIVIEGNRKFSKGKVDGKDLRGGIALVISALIAEGESEVDGVKYIKRGYSDLVNKLRKIGAEVLIERDERDEK